MEKVIITGAGGFIGRALIGKLLEKGYFVYAIDRNTNNLKQYESNERVKIIKEDLQNIENIENHIEKGIKYFYHFAWQGISSADYKDINVQKDNIMFSISVALLAIRLETDKFIFFGSNQQYLMNKNSIDNKYCESSVYGLCKASSDMLCKSIAMNHMKFNTIQFTNVFGVGDYSKRTANLFISKMLKGEDLDLIEGNNLYDWIYIDDAVRGIIAVSEKGVNNKSYYIGSRKLRTFKEIIIDVARILNADIKLNFGKYVDTSFTDYEKIDLEALFNDTGIECNSNFEESVKKTAEWVAKLDL